MNDDVDIVYRVQCTVERPHLPHRWYDNDRYEDCWCEGLWKPWGDR